MGKRLFSDRKRGENVVKDNNEPGGVFPTEYVHGVEVWRVKLDYRIRYVVRHYGWADQRMLDADCSPDFDREELCGRNATEAGVIRYAIGLLDDYAERMVSLREVALFLEK